ncbi:MAG TPA: carboxypeptidase-like regulatory domain-containing protein, partial [Kofleriaceae bacterium]
SDGYNGPVGQLSGKVYAPNQGPGQAAPGQEIPIAGALIYVNEVAPPGIPDGVYCEQCVATPSGGTVSAADGSFLLDAPPGNYWLTIQKGQYRVDHQVAITVGAATALPASMTTLPSQWNPEMHMWMPRIAMAQGTDDRIEDILAKLGVGTLSGNVYDGPLGENGASELTVLSYSGSGAGSVTHLLSNMAELRKYHIIFFPCALSMDNIDSLLRNQTILQNIRRYVSEGGKLYVTDWSGELSDRAFPQQIELGDFGADSKGTYDPLALTGNLTTVGSADGVDYDLDDGKAVDPDLHAWLGTQMGPHQGGGIGMYNPDQFEITGLYNWIRNLTAVMIGSDSMGNPVYDTPKSWVTGSKGGNGAKPVAVTYAPTGCGKVLYTAFQTANTSHAGLYEQERVLLYLIMEIQTCSDNPIGLEH